MCAVEADFHHALKLIYLQEAITQPILLNTSHAMSMTLLCGQSEIDVMLSTIFQCGKLWLCNNAATAAAVLQALYIFIHSLQEFALRTPC